MTAKIKPSDFCSALSTVPGASFSVNIRCDYCIPYSLLVLCISRRGCHHPVNEGTEVWGAGFPAESRRARQSRDPVSPARPRYGRATVLYCLWHVRRFIQTSFVTLPEQNAFCLRIRVVFLDTRTVRHLHCLRIYADVRVIYRFSPCLTPEVSAGSSYV